MIPATLSYISRFALKHSISSIRSSSNIRGSSSICSSVRNTKRYFGYESTLAYKLYGPKPSVLIIHPVVKYTSKQEIFWDAEEAVGLARAVKWNILPGPFTPEGGWNDDELVQVNTKKRKRILELGGNSEWHIDRGNDSDEEYDDDVLNNPVLRRQWAQSTITRIRQYNKDVLFSDTQIQQIVKKYQKCPCPYIFINYILTPLQVKNLELIFTNALVEMRQSEQGVERNSSSSDELREYVEDVRASVINEVNVIDRHAIVLEIFATRAHSKQAKLEVELARANYVRTSAMVGTTSHSRHVLKLIANTLRTTPQVTRLSKCVGFGGSSEFVSNNGESYSEYQRRVMDDALKSIRLQLSKARDQQDATRKNRVTTGTVALVGYTNAGKTTLMNRLTNNNLKVRDMLFQTLDTTCRKIKFPKGNIGLLVDSVGFIQDLPLSLYQSFQLTLAELVGADVLLHVRDMRHPQSDKQKDIVISTLKDANIDAHKLNNHVIEIWNKIDLLDSDRVSKLFEEMPPNAIPISATEGSGCDILLQVLSDKLEAVASKKTTTLEFPAAKAIEVFKYLKSFNNSLSIVNDGIRANDDGTVTFVDVVADKAALSKFNKYFNF